MELSYKKNREGNMSCEGECFARATGVARANVAEPLMLQSNECFQRVPAANVFDY